MFRPETDEGPRRRASRAQRGYLMAALAAAIAIMVIFSGLAFQAWADMLRRDNEAEMMFRAQDLVRAIQRYRRANGGVAPQKLEDLMKPGPQGQYFLRKLWKDPLVPDGKWGLLYVGPGGQIVDPNAEAANTGLGGGPGGSQEKEWSVFDRGRSEEQDSAERGTSSVPRPGRRQQLQGQQQQQQPQPQARELSADDPGADPSGGGKQLGGLPIAGVKSLCEEKPFRLYNGLTEYSEWRFTYLDLEAAQFPRRRQPGAPGASPQTGTGFGQSPKPPR